MPYTFEKEKLKIPRNKDKRVKLTLEQRQEIVENPEGLSIHALSKKYNVSRRLIQFIRYPERYTKNLQDRYDRGGTKIYYDKEKHNEAMKTHRKHKYELFKNNELEEN